MTSKRYHVERTDTSPQIDIDVDNVILEFIGRSLPHNSEQFYAQIYNWLDEYLEKPSEETTVNMHMDYLDTSSSRHLYNIFKRLNTAGETGNKVQVNWHFECGDEEMAETGKDYQSFFNMNFKFIEVEELF